MKITSDKNRWIKEVRKLKTKKGRRQTGLFVAEGLRFIQSLIELDASIEALLYDESMLMDDGYSADLEIIIQNLQKNSTTQMLEVSSDIINKLFDTKTPQGILAIVSQKKSAFEELLSQKKPILILDRLQDAGNVGTIIRTADCAGMGGIVLLNGSVDLYNDKVLRSTMGGVCSVPIVENILWEDVKCHLCDAGYTILCADIHADSCIYDVDYNKPVAVIIGNEANGISKAILEDEWTQSITIPNMGRMESLNASVAASVIMYEIVRQRLGK